MSANRQFLNTEKPLVRVPRLGLIVAAFFLGLILLILAHSWSQAKHFVSPLQILLGTPQASDMSGREPIAVARPDLVLVVQNVKWLLPKVVHVEFLRPDGASIPSISFSQPLEVCFTLAEDHWQAFTQDTGAYQVQYYADQQSPPAWQSLPQVTHPDRHQVCGQSDMLSMFGLAIRAQVGIPVTGLTAGFAQMLLPAPVATREHRERDSSASAPQSIPTNAPTNPPVVQPQPTDPPPVEPPAQDNGKKDQPPGQQKQKDPPPGQQKQDQQPNNDQKNNQPKDKKKN
jgi:hypothetical protein